MGEKWYFCTKKEPTMYDVNQVQFLLLLKCELNSHIHMPVIA